MTGPISIIRTGYPDEPGVDTALSRAMLQRTSRGTLPESFRLFTPGRVVAFGKRDTLEPGYPAAVAATRAGGFVPITRIAGGRAAVFHEGTLAFGWTVPAETPRAGVGSRFAAVAGIMADALRTLGIDARIGEVRGEYCPGRWSVNAGGLTKLMGVGQRLDRHAAHVGGVVVVDNRTAVNEILTPVYEALGISWRPEATGAVQDHRPDVAPGEVADAILATIAERRTLIDATLDSGLLAEARQLAGEHATVL
ncbi:MAG: lipoate--protein ligase family protein [Acidimicrobiia bacterium]